MQIVKTFMCSTWIDFRILIKRENIKQEEVDFLLSKPNLPMHAVSSSLLLPICFSAIKQRKETSKLSLLSINTVIGARRQHKSLSHVRSTRRQTKLIKMNIFLFGKVFEKRCRKAELNPQEHQHSNNYYY